MCLLGVITEHDQPRDALAHPGRACCCVLLSGSCQSHQNALRWCWKRLLPHGCSLMEPVLLCSPMPLGSISPANAVLRGVRISWCLLHLLIPSLGRCWWLRRPRPTEMGAGLVQRGGEESCESALLVLGNHARQSSCLFIFSCPVSP